MSKALSVDLRSRVVAAVKAGANHREAAARFGVSAASVSRWRRLDRELGDVRPGPLGGDRRSGRVEAQAAVILSLLDETGDITIEELRAALAERGHTFGYGTIHRFLKRRGITRKKRLATQSNRTVRTY
jgi:transposase